MRPADLRRLDAALSLLDHPANLIDVMRINIIADFAKHVGLEGVTYARWRLDREIASMAPKHEWYYGSSGKRVGDPCAVTVVAACR